MALYLQFLSYRYKGKEITWFSIQILDKKSIVKIILNYSLEDIEEKKCSKREKKKI